MVSTQLSAIPDDLRESVALAETMFIGGEWAPARSGQTLDVENPATGEVIARVAAGDASDVDRAVAAARVAFPGWRATNPAERSRLMNRLADLIEERADELARIDSLDVGMPYVEARYVDVAFSISILRYYAGWATKINGDTISPSFPQSFGGGPFHAYTLKEPIGVVAAITPWNIPLMMLVKKLAPALATGCVMVAKAAEITPLSTAVLGRLCQEAGIPDGVFNVVSGQGSTVGARLTEHPEVAKVTFTGSVATGKSIIRSAAETLKRVSLELGGKSPNIIFDDANLAKAIPTAAMAIFSGAGESCIAGSRLYVQRGVYQRVVEGLAARAEEIKVGPSSAADSEMGPLISAIHRDKVKSYFDLAREEGATIVAGGETAGDKGYFVKPTVLTGVAPGSRINREEIFGPVVSVIPFDTEDEVLAMANDSDYGLGSAVWTQDISRAHRMAAAIEAGQVWINTYQPVDPALPFGGYKQSGWGRETCKESLEDYLETKTVVVDLG
jgi:phenylacetaldehyde dehydrogenase